jgi:hypothetical protein
MPAPSVTYQFTNGTTADASQVNTNFSDIIDALTDGAADLDIGSLAVTNAVTLDAQTASRILITDASKVVTSADTATYPSLTELSYVKGVTSAIQTQLSAIQTITDWGASAWTPTGSWSANTTYTGKYRRVGDSFEAFIKVATSGAPTSADLTINLPASHTIDTAKLASTDTDSVLGHGYTNGLNPNSHIFVCYNNTTTVAIKAIGSGAQEPLDSVDQAIPDNWGAGDYMTFRFLVPIVEYT